MLLSILFLLGVYSFGKGIIDRSPRKGFIHRGVGFNVFEQQAIVFWSKLVPSRGSHPGRPAPPSRRRIHRNHMRLGIYEGLAFTAFFDPVVGYESGSFGFSVVSY